MKSLYAIITNNCNLKCPHCNIKDDYHEFDSIKFMNVVNSFDGRIILFGGEPTLYDDRMFEIVNDNLENGISKINAITTNLIKLDDRMIKLYQGFGGITTSWNLLRFSDDDYAIWKNNLKKLSNSNVHICINITMTPDLINYDMTEFLNTIDEWSGIAHKIRFEQLVSDDIDMDHFSRVDDWLCKLHDMWRSDIYCEQFNNTSWYFDCKGVYTLYPNGDIRVGCPNSSYVDRGINIGCMSCDNSENCLPCNLQRHCSRPKKLISKLSSGDF